MSTVTTNLVPVTQWGLVNMYLVVEDDGLTAIDAGQGKGAAKGILAAAERLGAPIRRLVLTHAHQDHVGAIDALAAKVDGLELMVSARDAKMLRGKPENLPGEPDGSFPPGRLGVKTEPARLLAPGDQVGSLLAVDAKGHSPGQLAFVDQRDGTMLCGDAFSTVGGVATSASTYWRFPLPAFFTWHKPTALETARRLTELAPTRLAPGHGKVVDDPVAAMQQAVARSAG